MVARVGSVVALVTLAACGCGGGHRQATQTGDASSFRFVPASPRLLAACRSTARAVGYPVPCPTQVPVGLKPFGGRPDCKADIIQPEPHCPNTVPPPPGWVVGSSATETQHLVLTASPQPLRNYAKVVNGPAWYPGARVQPLGWVTMNGWRIRAVFVPPDTNEGSAFAHHVVLIWSVGSHTYGVGFHAVHGRRAALLLDEELVRGIRLVGPKQRPPSRSGSFGGG